MKVFISWSGDLSKRLAEALRDWFPDVIQVIETFFTPADVDKGSLWESEIAGQLETSDFGILVLTPTNTSAPWLVFEAGALSKHRGKARVCPILFGLRTSEITGPLARFQFTQFTYNEMLNLIQTIRGLYDDARITEALVAKAFHRAWPDLEKRVGLILEKGEDAPRPREPKLNEVLDEILRGVRAIDRKLDEERTPAGLFGDSAN